jgi:hypothetical protein
VRCCELTKSQGKSPYKTFKAPEEEAMNIHQFFDNFDELEPVFVDMLVQGMENYFRGISPINELDESDREFMLLCSYGVNLSKN